MKQDVERQIVKLEITSFMGISFGAQHYYGKLTGYIGGDWKMVDVERPYRESDIGTVDRMLAPDERTYQQDLIRRSIARGETTTGFDTRDELCARAVELYRRYFPDAKMLLLENTDPPTPLDGPREFAAITEQAVKAYQTLERAKNYRKSHELLVVWESALRAILAEVPATRTEANQP